MTTPKQIWAAERFDTGWRDGVSTDLRNNMWDRYIHEDAPELVALVDAVKEIVSEAWGYDHLFETQFHAKVHDTLHSALSAYEALQ